MGFRTVRNYAKFLSLGAGFAAFIVLTCVTHFSSDTIFSHTGCYVVEISIPAILAMNLILFLYWLLTLNLKVFLPFITLAINSGAVNQVIGINGSGISGTTGDNILMVATYNVNYFTYQNNEVNIPAIAGFMQDRGVDILSMQEFSTDPYFNFDEIKSEFDFLPYTAGDFRKNENIIFSRYPVIRYNTITFSGTKNGLVWADLLFRGDTIRVINNHLQTTGIASKRGASYGEILSTAGKNYEKRKYQADYVRRLADTTSYPLIICGDFNDTPYSYTIKRILGNDMSDSFREAGNGAGGTYLHKYLFVRIDYILHNKTFKTLRYVSDKTGMSDHKPVIAAMEYKNKK